MAEEVKPFTPLPWEHTNEGKSIHGEKYLVCMMGDPETDGEEMRQAEDFDYIVHACNAYPALQAENERLRHVLELLRAGRNAILDDATVRFIDAALAREEKEKEND